MERSTGRRPDGVRRASALLTNLAARRGAGGPLVCSLALLLSVLALASPAEARSAFNWRQPMSGAGTPAAPGVSSPKPSAQALADALSQATGLTPSQVSVQNVCGPAASGTATCAAQTLVLRSNHRPVRPRVHASKSFTQIFPRRKVGIAPSAAPAGATGASAPQADTPAWLQQAYDLSYLSQTAGLGDTVGIVDAFGSPNAASDLAVFRANYGLPACTTQNGCLRLVNQYGQTSPLPSNNSDWEVETSLDLDAVSALCPNCHIVLVETTTNSFSDLNAGVQQAAALGANQISNSYGANLSYPISGTWTVPGVATVYSTGDHG